MHVRFEVEVVSSSRKGPMIMSCRFNTSWCRGPRARLLSQICMNCAGLPRTKPKKPAAAVAVTIRPTTDQRWKPRRTRDGVYCAPACGGGPIICSVERYENARRVAERVCRDLGEGWIGVLTHNLGWYAGVGSPCRRVWVSAHADLHRDPTGATIEGYTAFLGPPQKYGGSGKWAAHGKTPRKAIEAVLALAMSDLGLIQSITDRLVGLARKARR